MHQVRDEALEATWIVTRHGRRGVVTRRDGSGEGQELVRLARWRGLDRVGLASALLEDALGFEPSHRLAADLALFVVSDDPDGTRSMSAEQLQSWLDTWKPPFEKLFPIVDRKRKRS